jgi:uncharacterized membrane protein
MVWLAVLIAGDSVWHYSYRSPEVVVLSALMILGGIVGIASCWVVRSPRSRLFQSASMVSAVVAIIFPAGIAINVRAFYSTDSAAFEQVAARALLHGGDPYVVSMSGAASLLHVPARFWTYTVTGVHVSHFSYPAGAFLFDALAMALGFHHMVVDWVDLLAWLVTVGLLFALVPVSLRWFVALLGLTPFFVGTFSSGGTDALFLPFLVLAAWRWDRFGQDHRAGVARWIGPIALGLACAIKQTPWFCVPLLAIGIFLEARHSSRPAARIVVRYLSTVFVVFAAVNVPFILWHPKGWLHGTFLPLTGGLVADGRGLVILATQGVTGGVNLSTLSVAAGMAAVAVLVAFIIWYTRLKRICLVLVVIPFFFSPRSLSTYLFDIIPAALVAALSVHSASGRASLVSKQNRNAWLRRSSVLALTVPCVGVVVASALAFVGPPLQLSVQSITTSHSGEMMKAVTVSVHNLTDKTLTPHFMVSTETNPTGFWIPSGHRRFVLGPHDSAVLTLNAPASTTTPKKSARWVLVAYTQNPSWLSASPLKTSPP